MDGISRVEKRQKSRNLQLVLLCMAAKLMKEKSNRLDSTTAIDCINENEGDLQEMSEHNDVREFC